MFPLEEVISKDNSRELEVDLTSDRLIAMGESLMWQKPIPIEEGKDDPELHRAGNFYRYYHSIADLPEKARPFYNKAGKLEYL
jgi:hypothetical protein